MKIFPIHTILVHLFKIQNRNYYAYACSHLHLKLTKSQSPANIFEFHIRLLMGQLQIKISIQKHDDDDILFFKPKFVHMDMQPHHTFSSSFSHSSSHNLGFSSTGNPAPQEFALINPRVVKANIDRIALRRDKVISTFISFLILCLRSKSEQ